ncbi:MAG: oligoendopeptidase F [Firmicutes bacterium]|nr:oligoendopeptidase F [Bacillota bacterium]
MAQQLKRSEVPIEQTWNINDIFANKEEWEKELANLPNLAENIIKNKGKLDQGAKYLLECLEGAENLQTRARKVISYASLQLSSDGTNQEFQFMAGRAMSIMSELMAQTSFVQNEALALPEGTLENYLKEEEGLQEYRFTIQKWIEHKPYMLSAETEMVLASLSQVLGSMGETYERSRTNDLKFDSVLDSEGNAHPMSLARHGAAADLELRRNAYAELTKQLRRYNHTYGNTWGTETKKNVIMAKLRGYPSAIDMLLHQQEVNIDIYNNIHDVILTELAPHWRRYAQLRKEVLNLDKMLYCDIEAPLDPEYTAPVTYEEVSDMVLNGLTVLGDEYSEIMRKGLTERWIDRADNIGKRTGAFCNTVPGVHPYISLTWTAEMRNALTIAHELGHGGQGVLAQRYNKLTNSRPTMFFIEAPSTINELLVANYILDNTEDTRTKRWLVMQLLMTYHHNFVRHLIEGEVQRRTYALAEKGQPINASILNRIQGEILDEFYGGEVVIDEGSKQVWMRQAHYYRGLYPYSYAAGLTVGTAVARRIQAEGAPAAAQWIEVLKAGGTKKPLELCQMAGVDMTSKQPIQEAVAYVGSLVDFVIDSYKK